MIDVASGLSAFQAAKDIAENLINLRDTAKFQSAVVELQGKILAAQADQLALLERVRELEAEKAKLEAWEAEKQRYELKDFGGETFAYVLKEGVEPPEPPHSICPACYQKGQKSILQREGPTPLAQMLYSCPGCSKNFELGQRQDIPPPEVIY